MPPENGFVKINCDASFVHDPLAVATAAILRDSDGHIIGGRASMVHARSLDVAEALAIRLAWKLLLKLNFIIFLLSRITVILSTVSFPRIIPFGKRRHWRKILWLLAMVFPHVPFRLFHVVVTKQWIGLLKTFVPRYARVTGLLMYLLA
ncbi:hypothetical protein GQ457_08G026210 [Hibiscus cannabinus]